jgi:hypothetical protein
VDRVVPDIRKVLGDDESYQKTLKSLENYWNLPADDQIVENLASLKRLPQYVKEMRSAEEKAAKEAAKSTSTTSDKVIPKSPNTNVFESRLPVEPVIRDLIGRIKLGDTSATAAIKTIKKFATEKINKDPYWEMGELVPTKVASQLAEINRNIHPKYPEHLEKVRDYILEHGIDDMGIMGYHPENKIAHLMEGNTRTATARNLDIPFVPLRGYRSLNKPWERGPGGISAPNTNLFGGNRVPSEFKPSDLGFDVYDTEELLDIINKLKK